MRLGSVSSKHDLTVIHCCPLPASILSMHMTKATAQSPLDISCSGWLDAARISGMKRESCSVLTRLHYTIMYDIVHDGAVCVHRS